MDNYLEVFNNYYSIKQKYEHSIEKKKKVIINNDSLSTKERKQQIAAIRSKCISCKRPVGTIFTNKNKILIAKCGDTAKPCKLNIEIKRPNAANIFNLISNIENEIQYLETNIIITKLNHLFNNIKEEITLQKFEILKADLDKKANILQILNNKLISIIQNPQVLQQINDDKTSLFIMKKQLRANVTEFLKTNEDQFLVDNVTLYNDSIKSIVLQLMLLNYSDSYIDHDKNTNTYHLIQQPYTLEELLINKDELDNEELYTLPITGTVIKNKI